VSDVAASCALNAGKGSTRVSAETRERVLAAAERLRYRPNATARALSRQRANAIGFVANIANEEPNLYFLEVFNGVVRGATEAQQTTCIFPLSGWDEAPKRIPALCDGRVDGLVVLAPYLEDDSTNWLPPHTPMVTIHAGTQLQAQVNVEADDEAGGFGIVRHMLELGYRHILCVGGPPDNKSADRRVDGFLRAHAEAGIEVGFDHVIRTWFTTERAAGHLDCWLRRYLAGPHLAAGDRASTPSRNRSSGGQRPDAIDRGATRWRAVRRSAHHRPARRDRSRPNIVEAPHGAADGPLNLRADTSARADGFPLLVRLTIEL
jgi:LacI family transcriptional regulator